MLKMAPVLILNFSFFFSSSGDITFRVNTARFLRDKVSVDSFLLSSIFNIKKNHFYKLNFVILFIKPKKIFRFLMLFANEFGG